MFRTAVPILVALLVAMPAAAQAPPRAPKPYAPVAITRPAASDDASFIAFRAALAAKAKARIYAELAPLVLAQGFFWGRDFGQAFDPRKPAVDNLAAAIALEQGNGAGWDALAAFAAQPTIEPLDFRPGIVCAPARPGYDGIAFSRLLDTTFTTGIDWAYPRADETPVHTAPPRVPPKPARSPGISCAWWGSRVPTAIRPPAAVNGRASPCRTASPALSLPAT
jgi:hypothetical protein